MDKNYKLFICLQTLKVIKIDQRKANWFIKSRHPPAVGQSPYHAVEIAYFIQNGWLKSEDGVYNAKTKQAYKIADHPFLNQWQEQSVEVEHRIRQGLSECINNYRYRLGFVSQTWPVLPWNEHQNTEFKKALKILNLIGPASLAEVKHQYHQMALKYHPDHGGNSEKMQEINWAYEIIQGWSSVFAG